MENIIDNKNTPQIPQTQEPKISDRTKGLQERFIDNLEKSFGIITTACKATGVDRGTYYDWCVKFPEFKKRVEEVSELTKDMIESKALERVMADSDKMIIYLLSTKCKDRGYVQDRNHHISGEIKQEQNIDLDYLSDEEKQLLAKIYSKG
jgi:hypothetical protein